MTCNSSTFIPVPPSKHQTDPFFDDRLMDILKQFSALKNHTIDFRNAVTQTESIEIPSHLSDDRKRKSPDELYRLYKIDQIEEDSLRDVLIIFDDVLTAGSHYKAMKKILSQTFPNKRIAGLFIARTGRESKNN